MPLPVDGVEVDESLSWPVEGPALELEDELGPVMVVAALMGLMTVLDIEAPE